MKPSEEIYIKRYDLLNLLKKYEPEGIVDIQIFGSVARGEDTENSDLDLCFLLKEYTNLNAYFQFENEIEELLDTKVEIGTRFDPWIFEVIENDFYPFKKYLEDICEL